MHGILNGDCTYLRKGEEVYVEHFNVFTGNIQVRPRGSTVELWGRILIGTPNDKPLPDVGAWNTIGDWN